MPTHNWVLTVHMAGGPWPQFLHVALSERPIMHAMATQQHCYQPALFHVQSQQVRSQFVRRPVGLSSFGYNSQDNLKYFHPSLISHLELPSIFLGNAYTDILKFCLRWQAMQVLTTVVQVKAPYSLIGSYERLKLIAAFTFRVTGIWRQLVSPKYWYSPTTRPYDVITQNTLNR